MRAHERLADITLRVKVEDRLYMAQCNFNLRTMMSLKNRKESAVNVICSGMQTSGILL